MLAKSQHLENKGKKIESSRSFLDVTGGQDQPGIHKTTQGLSHPEHSAPSLTHGDWSGSLCLACRGRQGCSLALA